MVYQDNVIKIGLIRSSIRLRIPLEKQSEAIDLLESVRDQIQVEPNCIYSRLYREANTVDAIMIEELWANEKDMLIHLKSNVYRRILFAIDMADTSPEIRFDKILQSNGFETIKNVRQEIKN